MAEGRVKWLMTRKAMDFITADGGKELFVHSHLHRGQGFKTLEEGERSQLRRGKGQQRPQAVRVKKLQ